jgi:hypothetical protein
MSEFTVRAVQVRRVYESSESWIGLEPVEFVPVKEVRKFAPVVEPFSFDTNRLTVPAWTEDALRRMDKLGIPFPVSVSLYGPILLPSIDDASMFVPVWYSTGFNWQGGFDIIVAAVRIVDELMAGTLADELLSYEDRRFLAWHYPSWRNAPQEYNDAVDKRLREGVRESEQVMSDV